MLKFAMVLKRTHLTLRSAVEKGKLILSPKGCSGAGYDLRDAAVQRIYDTCPATAERQPTGLSTALRYITRRLFFEKQN